MINPTRISRILRGATALCLFLSSSVVLASTPHIHRIVPGPTPQANPLKGLIAYSGSTSFPHSMEWFYLPVNSVQKGPNTFDWTALEKKLNEIASRGDQACLRFYYDYPAEPNGIPAYLLVPGKSQLALNKYTDYGGGYSPDYNSNSPGSRRFRESMQRFIAAFGAKYDGDPRIGFITAGLLGFWGEWHTYPHLDWTPSDSTMNLVLAAYTKAFHKTRLLVRYPAANAPKMPVGFHDDAFGSETLYEHDWNFAQRLKNAGIPNVWQSQPIGGEVFPSIQTTVFVTGKGDTGEPWADCVAAVHPTWMLDNEIKRYQGNVRDAAIRASEGLGYNLRVTTATFPDVVQASKIGIGVHVDNIGIAPFYYRWASVVALKRRGAVVKTWKTSWDLRQIPAGGGRDFAVDAAVGALPPGVYTLAMRVVNPMRGGKPLLFANTAQNPNGWLDLGSIRIAAR
jgi:hypothetical protein